MKKQLLIFYGIVTSLVLLIIFLEDTIFLPYLQVLYVVFTFAESYFVLQNWNFDHGVPYVATFIKLTNTIAILYIPEFALAIYVIVNIYILIHLRNIPRRPKRLKFDYTVNNIIPGPFLLKVFGSFLNPFMFAVIIIITNIRIVQKLEAIKRVDLFKYIIIPDLCIFIISLTPLGNIAFLIYMIMLIMYEFVPIQKGR